MIAHLVRGLQILGERWWSGPWVAAADSVTDRRVRRGLLLVMAAAAYRMLLLSWWLLGGTLLIVCIRALRAATKEALGEPEKTAAPPAEAPAEAAGTDRPDVDQGVFLQLLHDVLGTATGVHLRTLAAALTARTGTAWEVADVRRLCEGSGVPVRPTVRAPGGGPTVGVHRDDLGALPQPLPEGAPVAAVADYAAGQNGTTPATTPAPTTPTTPTVTVHRGVRIVTRDDPDNPARAHVTVIDPTRKKASK